MRPRAAPALALALAACAPAPDGPPLDDRYHYDGIVTPLGGTEVWLALLPADGGAAQLCGAMRSGPSGRAPVEAYSASGPGWSVPLGFLPALPDAASDAEVASRIADVLAAARRPPIPEGRAACVPAGIAWTQALADRRPRLAR